MLKKKITALLLAISLIPATVFAAPATTTSATIKVEYNKKAIAFPDQKPLIRDKRTLVPIRPIAEALGFHVDWNAQSRMVTIAKGTSKVSLVVSQKIAKRNGETIQLDVPAQIVNKRTVVPVRFIAEALNYEVNWDAPAQTVKIADKQQTTGPTQPTLPTQPTQPTNPTTPAKQTGSNLIDKETVKGIVANIVGFGIYKVTGKVTAGTQLTWEFGDNSYDVPVEADGSFELVQESEDGFESYTLKATKGTETDTYEGKFVDQYKN